MADHYNEEVKMLAEQEEPRFLSILLRDKDCLMDTVGFGIKPGRAGHFIDQRARMLYDMIFKYYKKYDALLTRTSLDSFVKSQDIDEADQSALIIAWDKVFSLNCSSEDYSMLRDHINERYVQRQALEIFHDDFKELALSKAYQIDIVKGIQDKINAVDGLHADPYSLTVSFEEGVKRAMEHITERREHPDKNPGILTGIKAIDEMYWGFAKGDYVVVSGMVNGGKTTLMFNIGFNMARAGYNVAYVSLEKQAIPVVERLMSLHGMIDYNRIKRGGKEEYGLSDYYYKKYQEVADDLLNNIKPNFHVVQMVQGTPLSKILAELDRVNSSNKLDVIIVDYLGVIGLESHTQGRPDLDLANVSLRLQAYGRKLHAVTITGVQITNLATRDVRKRSQKAEEDASAVSVNTEDLGGSQRVIADADHGISIVLNNDSPPTKAFAHSTKARDSESKVTVTLDFDGRIGRISDPVLEPGQVKEVDDIVYNKEIIEEVLKSDDDLFSLDEEKEVVPVDKIDELGDLYEVTEEKVEEIIETKRESADDFFDI